MKIHKNKSNDEKIIRNSRLGREKDRRNAAHTKELERTQKDDHLKINNYSEGYCYGCSNRDKILRTLVYICTACYRKRGTEGLFVNIACKECEELCDICGFWKLGVWQRNVSFCDKCVDRTEKIHAKYNRNNKQNPFQRRLRIKYGKDYKILTGIN